MNLSTSDASKADPGVIPPSAFETVSTPFGSNNLESLLGWSKVACPRDDVTGPPLGGGDDELPCRPEAVVRIRRLEEPLPWLAAAGLRVPRSRSRSEIDFDELFFFNYNFFKLIFLWNFFISVFNVLNPVEKAL